MVAVSLSKFVVKYLRDWVELSLYDEMETGYYLLLTYEYICTWIDCINLSGNNISVRVNKVILARTYQFTILQIL